MSILKNTICLLALCALLSLTLGQSAQGGSHTSQGGAHENQGRSRRQADQSDPEGGQVEPQGNGVTVNWTTCDQTVTPKFSCLDCNTRLICLPIGGKTISCPKVYAPYCNGGYCSPIPSVDCQ